MDYRRIYTASELFIDQTLEDYRFIFKRYCDKVNLSSVIEL